MRSKEVDREITLNNVCRLVASKNLATDLKFEVLDSRSRLVIKL